tara:strand:- start:34103 stop:34342 length:240 start_codon:yes stop_codon:yes gene_type:complete
MQEIFIYALAISIIFFLFKFIEMKFLPEDDKKPLKGLLKETLIVYIASVSGIYLYSQFANESMNGGNKNTMAFVDNPSF